VMMAHPLALQLRNLQTLVEIGVERNTTIMFPAPLMSTIQELTAFLSRETLGAHADSGHLARDGEPMPNGTLAAPTATP
jgi:hypothetical protein